MKEVKKEAQFYASFLSITNSHIITAIFEPFFFILIINKIK